jgi:hypothetical protein
VIISTAAPVHACHVDQHPSLDTRKKKMEERNGIPKMAASIWHWQTKGVHLRIHKKGGCT